MSGIPWHLCLRGHSNRIKTDKLDESRAVLMAALKAAGIRGPTAAARLLNGCGFRPANGEKFTYQAVGQWWRRVEARTDLPTWEHYNKGTNR